MEPPPWSEQEHIPFVFDVGTRDEVMYRWFRIEIEVNVPSGLAPICSAKVLAGSPEQAESAYIRHMSKLQHPLNDVIHSIQAVEIPKAFLEHFDLNQIEDLNMFLRT